MPLVKPAGEGYPSVAVWAEESFPSVKVQEVASGLLVVGLGAEFSPSEQAVELGEVFLPSFNGLALPEAFFLVCQ